MDVAPDRWGLEHRPAVVAPVSPLIRVISRLIFKFGPAKMAVSQKLFGTDGVRGIANSEPITARSALRLAQAAGRVLAKEEICPTVVVGRDTRASGEMLEAAVAAGLASNGIQVLLAGIVPTPAVAYLTTKYCASFGMVISASHNPFQDNGIKFFGANGYKLTDETELAIESEY